MPAGKVLRSIHEKARDVAREIARTVAYVTSRRERKKIEMLFEHLKRILRRGRRRDAGVQGSALRQPGFHLDTRSTARDGLGEQNFSCFSRDSRIRGAWFEAVLRPRCPNCLEIRFNCLTRRTSYLISARPQMRLQRMGKISAPPRSQ
jgi:hypothetical protein